MSKQYSISLKTRFYLRSAVFVLMILLNIIFAVCGLTGIYGNAGKIAAVTFSSLIFCTWLVACVLADYEIIKSLFSAPNGYYTFLAPVAGWKILLGRLTAILTWDIPGFVIGVAGIVIQSFVLSKLPFSLLLEGGKPMWEMIFILIAILQFILLMLTVFLIAAITKSIFFRVKARALLGTLGGILVYYVMSWLDIILTPFSAVRRSGLFITFQITSSDYLAAGIYLLLTLLKIVILFHITSSLMERKVNI